MTRASTDRFWRSAPPCASNTLRRLCLSFLFPLRGPSWRTLRAHGTPAAVCTRSSSVLPAALRPIPTLLSRQAADGVLSYGATAFWRASLHPSLDLPMPMNSNCRPCSLLAGCAHLGMVDMPATIDTVSRSGSNFLGQFQTRSCYYCDPP
ncbi:hypothetical protein FB451DRAFT_1238658 [Mycena latifolia]|nr:hypothetical protein FB451DRAFT_1238658 [Mycena latifolia]